MARSLRPPTRPSTHRRATAALRPRLLALSLLPVALFALGSDSCAGRAPEAGSAPTAPTDASTAAGPAANLLVVRVVGDGAEQIAGSLEEGEFFRWMLPRLEGWRVEIEVVGDGPLGPVGKVPGTSGNGTPGKVSGTSGKVSGTAGGIGDGGGGRRVEVIAGTLPWPAGAAALARGLPVDLGVTPVALDDTPYDDPRTTLSLAPPGEDGVPGERWLVAGALPDAVASAASRAMMRAVGVRFWGQEEPEGPIGYVVREGPHMQRIGSWRPARADGGVETDRASERDDFGRRERWIASLAPVAGAAGERVRLLVPDGQGRTVGTGATGVDLVALGGRLDRRATAMARRLPRGDDLLARPVVVALEADFVSQGRHTGAIGPAVAGGAGIDLHAVVHPDDLWALEVALARVLLERSGAVDEATPPWLADGAALLLADGWYGRPYRDWLPVLAAAGALPTPDEAELLLAPARRGDASEPLWTPAAAAVVAGAPGDGLAEKLVRAGDPEHVRRMLGELALEATEAPEPVRERPLPQRFLRGVSLAMANSLEGGYHAPSVGVELDRLCRLGADAVALMPFAYQGDPTAPRLEFLNDSPSSETDIGLVQATRTARERGFVVLSKPHLWISGDSWPGEVAMTSEADWEIWWRSYRRYVLHHAFLAAYAGADLFSLGVELERTVGQESRWERLAGDVERLFPGPLTYAANWYRGAEEATFWDHLDAVGVDAYYPLADGERADDAALARGAARVAARLEALAMRTGKPVLLTEVGFAARQGAWDEPHREGGELSLEDQQRAYRALFAALDDQPWLRGLFVWKSFSGSHRPGSREAPVERPDFRFLGRPAETAVAEYFARTSDRREELEATTRCAR